MKQIVYCITFLLTLQGCAPALYLPTQAHADWVTSTYQHQSSVSEMNSIRSVYSNYCSACHDLHMPDEYSIADWGPIYQNMSSRITAPDSVKQKIFYYILAGARDNKIK